MDRDPKFEFEGFENHKDRWRALFEEYNQEMSDKTPSTSDQETGAKKRDRIIAKYQEVRILSSMNSCFKQASLHLISVVQNMRC